MKQIKCIIGEDPDTGDDDDGLKFISKDGKVTIRGYISPGGCGCCTYGGEGHSEWELSEEQKSALKKLFSGQSD